MASVRFFIGNMRLRIIQFVQLCQWYAPIAAPVPIYVLAKLEMLFVAVCTSLASCWVHGTCFWCALSNSIWIILLRDYRFSCPTDIHIFLTCSHVSVIVFTFIFTIALTFLSCRLDSVSFRLFCSQFCHLLDSCLAYNHDCLNRHGFGAIGILNVHLRLSKRCFLCLKCPYA